MTRFLTLTLAALAVSASAASPFQSKQMQTKNTPKAKLMAKMIEKAEPTENSVLSRNLEQAGVDLSGYEIKFEKCQFVKTYDDELAQDESAGSVLATKRFAVFRLCPYNKCGSCNSNFGEYVIDLDSYLTATTEYFVEDREETCTMCNKFCGADDDVTKSSSTVNCNSCVDYCESVNSLQENGYLESYEFSQCIQVYDNGNSQIYAGAHCSNNGKSLKIGAFSDQDCSAPDGDAVIEEYIGSGISFDHDILSKTYDSRSCIPCGVMDENENYEEIDLCNTLYEMSAKCESKFGFDNFWKGYDDYTNQYLQEELVCDYISSLKNGNYDQYGEIVLTGLKRQGSGGANATQKLALSVFTLGSIVLGLFTYSVNTKLKKGDKADLSSQGGAMA